MATDEKSRLRSTTTLTIRVVDVDDQDPVFDTAAIPESCPADLSSCIPEYRASITEGRVSGVLTTYPGRIHAKDMDAIGSNIVYSFVSGTPSNFELFFEIDSRTATIKQIRPIDRSQIKQFELYIQAMENSARQGKATARLLINIEDVDLSPPEVVLPSFGGIVQEASAPGTPVIRDDGSGLPFILAVTDPDIVRYSLNACQ